MTGNEVAGPDDPIVTTAYEAALEKRNAEAREEEAYLARIESKLDEMLEGSDDELVDEALDVIAAIQRSYQGAAPRETRVETPDGPRYRRLDKVAPEDHLDGRKMTRYVAQDENGGQVLVEVYWKREDHPVGLGAYVIDRMTLAFRGGPLESWGPPSEAREA